MSDQDVKATGAGNPSTEVQPLSDKSLEPANGGMLKGCVCYQCGRLMPAELSGKSCPMCGGHVSGQ